MNDAARQTAGGTAEEEASEEELPRRFGKYTLLRRLAVGGMAELYLALQRSVAGFEKLIVVKRILPTLASDENFVQMLLAEARIAATLNHPNIAQVYDVGLAEEDYFIAMEHVHGEDLRSIVRQMRNKAVRSFPLEHTLAIVLGCCKGLSYAHERRDLDGAPMEIVHRDVSPQNVLVTFTGDVKLVDFGIAKARDNKDLEEDGKLKGKIPYMSPEQAQGMELDGRSDVFSLGVMLFELCTGKRLFRGTDEQDTLRIIVEGNYPAPRSINPHLPVPLEQIIQKALAPSRSHRYESARAMQADLEGFIRETQMAVSPLSLGEWMQTLFDDKLAQQKQMLQEGRQLAEVLAAQSVDDVSLTGVSAVRVREPSKAPWLITALFALLLAGGIAAYFFLVPTVATGPGVLDLRSEPSGAAIWIDGARRSERTPATLTELPLGSYEVRLTSEGFVPHIETLVLTEAEPGGGISATLERPTADAYAVVRLRTTPAGASVLLDGTAVEGVTPLTIPQIAPGEEHTLAITLDGYETHTMQLLLRAGQVEDSAVNLQRTPLAEDESLLVVRTTPPDARVVIEGATYDDRSPYEIRIPARRTRVLIVKTGYVTQERFVEPTGGEALEVSVELERERGRPSHMGMTGGDPDPTPTPSGPGQLTFDARPWCNVSIDGRAVGQTPIVNRTLPSGSHRITCTNPELGVTRNVNVTIEAGETTRQRVDLQ